jgi:outer membrane protein assembly factor BamB
VVRPSSRPAWRACARVTCSLILLGGVSLTQGASAETNPFASRRSPPVVMVVSAARAPALVTPAAYTHVALSSASSARTVTPTPTAAASGTPGALPRHRVPRSTPSATASATGTFVGLPGTPIVTHYSLTASWPMAGHDAGQSYADLLGSIVPSAIPLMHLRWQAPGLTPQVEAGGVLYAIDSTANAGAYDAAMGTLQRQYQTPGVIGVAYQSPNLYLNRSSEIRIVNAATAGWSNSATDSAGGMVPSFSSLIVSGRRIYTGAGPSSATTLAQYYAFDAVSGSIIWQHPGSFTSTPALVHGTLYVSFGTFGSADTYAIDAENGFQLRMLKNLGAIQWNAAGDRVYASLLTGPSDSLLHASIRAYDRFGKPLWVAHDILYGAALPEIMYGIAPGAIDARSAKDGHRIWKASFADLSSISPGSVAVSGNLVVVQANDGRIRLLDRDTGVLLRTLKPPFPAMSAHNLIVGGGIIFESIKHAQQGAKNGPPTLLAFGP